MKLIATLFGLVLLSGSLFAQPYRLGGDTIYYDPSNPPQVFKGGVEYGRTESITINEDTVLYLKNGIKVLLPEYFASSTNGIAIYPDTLTVSNLGRSTVSILRHGMLIGTSTVTVRDSSLVAWYVQDSVKVNPVTSWIDASIYANTAINETTPPFLSDSSYYNQAIIFNGVDNFLTAGDQPELDFGTGDFTIISNIYTGVDLTNFRTIVNKGGLGTVGYGLSTRSSVFRFHIQATSGTNQSFTWGLPQDSTVYNIAIVADRDAGIIGYIDGDSIKYGTYSTGNTNSITNALGFTIGRFSSPAQYYYDGKIYQIMVFNRALSSSEIALLYNKMILFDSEAMFLDGVLNPNGILGLNDKIQ